MQDRYHVDHAADEHNRYHASLLAWMQLLESGAKDAGIPKDDGAEDRFDSISLPAV